MINKSLKEIEILSEGSGLLDKYYNTEIKGVSTDTRTISQGNLFVPLIGDNFNGHNFIEDAIKSGALAALWQKDIKTPDIDFPFILVEDTLKGLQTLAKNYRSSLKNLKVVGITGSNGKTSTKDILEGILSTKYKTQKTMGNYNNHIGVPLTLLSLDEDTEVSIVEMGTDGFGQISLLTKLTQPDLAIITNIGPSHLEDLGSLENVAKAKLEILDGLNINGSFIYNGDDKILKKAIKDYNIKEEILTFGQNEGNNFKVKLLDEGIHGIEFSISSREETEEFKLPMLARHNIYNAGAAIIVGRKLAISYEDIQKGFFNIKTTQMRNDIIEKDNFTIINDAYNSNPKSLAAALDTIKSIDGYDNKFLVVGDMLGLGPDSIKYHREIGKIIDPEEIDKIFTLGDLAKELGEAAKINFPSQAIVHSNSKEELVNNILDNILDKTLVLVKASRGVALEEVIDELIK